MFYSFIVAFFYFDPKLGIGGSEAVGLNNFVDFIGSIILICAGSLGIVYFLVSGAMDSKVSVADVLTDQNIARALRNSLVYSLGSAVLFALMSILLAYPLTTRSKVYPVVLFQVLVANGLIAEWQVYRALGIHDSVTAAILSGGISVTGAFVLHLFTRNKTTESKCFGDFVRLTAPTAVLLLALNFIITWGNSNIMIFLSTRSLYPISLILRELFVRNNNLIWITTNTGAIERAQAMKYATGIVASLPPVFMGWWLIWSSGLFFGKKAVKAELN